MSPDARVRHLEELLARRHERRAPSAVGLARTLLAMDTFMHEQPVALDDEQLVAVYGDRPAPHVAAERLRALTEENIDDE